MTTRICVRCEIEKPLNAENFYLEKDKRKNSFYFKKTCKECYKIIKNKYYQENKEGLLIQHKEYNKEYKKRIHVKEKRSIVEKHKRLKDLNFKLRDNVSSAIKVAIKRNDGNKNGKSFKKYLSYTIRELKAHLENQFEPWMTWKNWGNYNPKAWDDNDSSTWTWQLDHIIPQSTFKYTSMEDESFQKCWALENLRPFSAKQNIIDGANKKRC